MKEYECKFCGKKFAFGEDAVKHLLSDCGIKGNKEKYWRYVVKLAFEDIIKEIAKGRLNIDNIGIDEFRATILLASIGLVKIPELNLTPEEIQILILSNCPELVIYAMEYAEIVEVKDGKVKLKDGV